ncbi:MAG: LrgB family protein [Alphaproteobacteria bacterium]
MTGTYLSGPLFGVALTLVVYRAALMVFHRFGRHPLANPVLISVACIAGFLKVTGIEYQEYFDGAQLIHFLLGPATVALAIPLYRQVQALRARLPAVLVAVGIGSVTAIASAVGIALALGASPTTVLSLVPKSVTTPIAMGIAQEIGGLPSLTAVLVILTGIVGAITEGWVFRWLRVADERARGLGIGVAAHGIGTAHALHQGEATGAFSGLGLGLNGVVTALLVPFLIPLVMKFL